MVPEIETERLRLRGHTLADLDAMAAMWADADVTRFTTGAPSSYEDSWGRMLRYCGHWALLGFGYWLVEEKQTARFIGDVGFGDFKRSLSSAFDGKAEQGWGLAQWARGKGYALEAVLAQLAWAKAHLGAEEVVCVIAAANAASIRLAERAGYVEFARAEYRGEPNILFRCAL